MYDLIIDEVFAGSFATWNDVIKELVDFEPMLRPVNVRIDYHE